MSLHNVTPGAKAPEEFNVIIELRKGFRGNVMIDSFRQHKRLFIQINHSPVTK